MRVVQAIGVPAYPLDAAADAVVVALHSTADSNSVKSVQEQLGAEPAGTMLESALAAIARGLVERGVRQLIVAGGGTAGACVQALNVTQMNIGPQIDPGVPWCYAQSNAAPASGLHLALKSGNFGTDDFFVKAFSMLEYLKVQMDLYHCQIVEGDLTVKLRRYLPFGRVGHVQIAGVPERHEPDVGELNYRYLFDVLDDCGYTGWVGCEYRPRAGAQPGGTSGGLGWLRDYR